MRGHQVRKNHGKIIWSVGILEKVILRWRRKGCGLRGFKSEGVSEGNMVQGESSTEDEYDLLKEGRKQTEQRLQIALARVKSMVQYPEARDQYHRLLNVATEIQENQVCYPLLFKFTCCERKIISLKNASRAIVFVIDNRGCLVFFICLLQVKHERTSNNSEETREFDNLIDLEALLDEDIFMPTAT